ncbi:MAG: recombinase family protein [Oscillospiraceae bacterium]|jgi:DNA invertase Pin-like site-specific DNA recombinase
MPENTVKVWNTCGYVRLSREDGDKEESNSVKGQKELIRDYLRRAPDLRECDMKVDDGYTGSNFERPAFQEMMADIKAGKINCIVVKDLSRFGRDHLEAGTYIEKIFPVLGVRFIAINDHYDSLHRNPESDELIVPFKNLVNEAYCRDISIKTRSHLDIKRRNGDFIGAFPMFGYRKDPENHNRLLIDDEAASVVRDIFRWKLDGVSTQDIADRLNAAGVPTPMDYKAAQGMRYQTKFRKKAESAWGAKTVLRILKNPIYIGTLEQGRTTTPTYRVKRQVNRPQSEWAIVENNHDAIIERNDFETIQRVLALDTRTSVGGEAVEFFSGLLFCGECGASMVRKTVSSGKKKYVYYVCSAHKQDKVRCSAHRLRDITLNEIVLDSLKRQIQNVIDLSDLLQMTDTARLRQASMQRLQKRLDRKRQEIERAQMLLQSLYENLADGIIDRDDYKDLKAKYTRRRQEAEEQADGIREEMSQELAGSSENRIWMEQFRKYQNITELDRAVIVTLIERIMLCKDHTVEIVFRWQNEYQWLVDLAVRQAHSEQGVG